MKIKKCPAISPRLPDDDRFPNGYMESDIDFIEHNAEWLDWCENNAELIRMLPDIVKALHNSNYYLNKAFEFDGDVFDVHSNNATDAKQAAETILEKIKKNS